MPSDYRATMEWLFDTYADLIGRMVPYYETLYPQQEGDSDFIWRSTIRAKACDDLRGLLPASDPSNVGDLRQRPGVRDDAAADAGPSLRLRSVATPT